MFNSCRINSICKQTQLNLPTISDIDESSLSLFFVTSLMSACKNIHITLSCSMSCISVFSVPRAPVSPQPRMLHSSFVKISNRHGSSIFNTAVTALAARRGKLPKFRWEHLSAAFQPYQPWSGRQAEGLEYRQAHRWSFQGLGLHDQSSDETHYPCLASYGAVIIVMARYVCIICAVHFEG